MSIRDKLLAKLAIKSRLITGVVFFVCLYFFSVLPSLASRSGVEEDTMATGGTHPFITDSDLISTSGSVASAIARAGMRHYRFQIDEHWIDYTVAESKRGDSREAVICAIVGDSQGAASLGLTVAKAMARSDWLGRDVYFVFVPSGVKAFAFGLRAFLDDFLTAVEHPIAERPIVRAAFVVEVNANPTTAVITVEGVNGVNANADMSALAMEVADEVRMPLRIRPGFESIAFSAMNGGVHAQHSAFHGKAIPSITVSLSTENLMLVSNFVGKYLRALTGLFHQLHHSGAVFVYTGYRMDVSLGILVPLMVGLVSPLYTSVLLPENNREEIKHFVAMLVFAFSAVVIVGGSSLLALLSAAPAATDCKSLISSSFMVPDYVWMLTGASAVVHVGVSRILERYLRLCDFATTLKVSAQIVYSMVLTMLYVYHCSGAVLAVALVVPLLVIVTPIRSKNRALALLSAVGLAVATMVFMSLFVGYPLSPSVGEPMAVAIGFVRDTLKGVKAPIALPVEFLTFLHKLITGAVSFRKDIPTLIQETLCVQGLALPILLVVIFPALLLTLGITIAKPGEPVQEEKVEVEVTVDQGDEARRRKRKIITVVIAGVALAASHYFNQ